MALATGLAKRPTQAQKKHHRSTRANTMTAALMPNADLLVRLGHHACAIQEHSLKEGAIAPAKEKMGALGHSLH
eukprot:15277139-Alexandrium_andersonii.AAC.1